MSLTRAFVEDAAVLDRLAHRHSQFVLQAFVDLFLKIASRTLSNVMQDHGVHDSVFTFEEITIIMIIFLPMCCTARQQAERSEHLERLTNLTYLS